MLQTISTTKIFCGAAAFLFVCGSAAIASAQANPNGHIDLVERHLRKENFKLPMGDYVLFASQPQGVVGTVVVHDLTNGKTTYLPATHSGRKHYTVTLTPEKAKLIREVMGLESVRTLPRESDKVGFDGNAFVALIKLGDRTQQLGQWESDTPAVLLLRSWYASDCHVYHQQIEPR